jgi:hypothetical protein
LSIVEPLSSENTGCGRNVVARDTRFDPNERMRALRRSVDTYGHLVPYAAQQAVDAIAEALADAERCRSDAGATRRSPTCDHNATTIDPDRAANAYSSRRPSATRPPVTSRNTEIKI